MVIVTAALTAVDYCDTNEEEAFRIDAEGPGVIARLCKEIGAKVVFISTNFVFDGSKVGR